MATAHKETSTETQAEEVKELNPLEEVSQYTGLPLEKLEGWKKQFHDIYFLKSPFRDQAFIFRPISRSEWRELRSNIKGDASNIDEILQEKLVMQCVLFPKIGPMDLESPVLRAWTVDTLVSQIKLVSDFLPDAVAVELITRL